MSDGTVPLVAVVGFKRSRLAWVGPVRVLVVHDGRVRLHDKNDRVDIDVPVDQLTARLTRTRTVHLRWPEGSAIVYGISEMTRLKGQLKEIVEREGEGAEFIGTTPVGALGVYSPKNVTGTAAASRAVAQALHERGIAAG